MLHKLLKTVGLGVLGIDPITAVYLLSMSLRKEKNSKITLFFLSFAGSSIFAGVGLATFLGVTAAGVLERIMPGDNSPVWAVLEFSISIFILTWVFKRVFKKTEKTKDQKNDILRESNLKYIFTGFVFAISSFTDPTFYAVILMGGESGNAVIATVLVSIWFAVSQFMAITVYIAHKLNLVNQLTRFLEKIRNPKLKIFTRLFYSILVCLALALMIDTGYYLFVGRYLF